MARSHQMSPRPIHEFWSSRKRDVRILVGGHYVRPEALRERVTAQLLGGELLQTHRVGVSEARAMLGV